MSRLLKSRKLWGAIIGAIFIVLVLKVGTTVTIPTAITAIGALFSLAIGGQAGADFYEARKEEKKTEIELEMVKQSTDENS